MKPMIALIVLGSLVVGCSQPAATNTTAPSKLSEKEFQDESGKMAAAAWPTDVKIHRNKEGKVVCGVLGDVIESPDKSVGFQDYKGQRYYFCCEGCPESFKKEPEKYADKSPALTDTSKKAPG